MRLVLDLREQLLDAAAQLFSARTLVLLARRLLAHLFSEWNVGI